MSKLVNECLKTLCRFYYRFSDYAYDKKGIQNINWFLPIDLNFIER